MKIRGIIEIKPVEKLTQNILIELQVQGKNHFTENSSNPNLLIEFIMDQTQDFNLEIKIAKLYKFYYEILEKFQINLNIHSLRDKHHLRIVNTKTDHAELLILQFNDIKFEKSSKSSTFSLKSKKPSYFFNSLNPQEFIDRFNQFLKRSEPK